MISKAEVITTQRKRRRISIAHSPHDDAPNVHVSVTVLGQGNDFRSGTGQPCPVAPDAQELKVPVVLEPGRGGTARPASHSMWWSRTTPDQPVQGEFSLSVVDLAIVLALADPNAG
ncbi:MAG: hypothetical protein M0C28_44285 [Candidatus Moduliflexus flocculans]|nr:hypothetical protein [Candidatus Moduliflexus flocculans]